jgi:hypothetical protein
MRKTMMVLVLAALTGQALTEPVTYRTASSGYNTAQMKGAAIVSTASFDSVFDGISFNQEAVYTNKSGQLYLTEVCGSEKGMKFYVGGLGLLVTAESYCHAFVSPVAIPKGSGISCSYYRTWSVSCSVFGVESGK